MWCIEQTEAKHTHTQMHTRTHKIWQCRQSFSPTDTRNSLGMRENWTPSKLSLKYKSYKPSNGLDGEWVVAARCGRAFLIRPRCGRSLTETRVDWDSCSRSFSIGNKNWERVWVGSLRQPKRSTSHTATVSQYFIQLEASSIECLTYS